jgi:acetyltransferase-like isoleucine patch superfamily enzyme
MLQHMSKPRRRVSLPPLVARVLWYLKREVEAYEVSQWKKSFGYCGDNVDISSRCSIWGCEGLKIGDNSCINPFTHIFASGGVKIGRNVMISANCTISSVTHPDNVPDRRHAPLLLLPVTICDDAWIGMGAVILPGVTIGANAIVGAGAVVTRDVAANAIVVGNPARFGRLLSLRVV